MAFPASPAPASSPPPDGTTLLHPGSVHLPARSAVTEEARAGAADAPSLVGARCAACLLVVFPAMPVCPRCTSTRMAQARIGRTARLYSHSIAHVAPQGFVAPYFQAFVDLPEGPRIFTLIGREVPVEDGRLVDGAELRLVVEPLADTPERRHLLAYKYVPAAPGPRRERGAAEGMARHA